MGTNYYLKTAACECCGLHDERNTMHIGKSSYGWCFSLHVGKWLNDLEDSPEAHSLKDWQELWSREGWVIVNEYKEPITPEDILRIITMRGGEYGYSQDGMDVEHHKVDGRHCIGHGEGTWDYITGEFS